MKKEHSIRTNTMEANNCADKLAALGYRKGSSELSIIHEFFPWVG